MFKKDLIIVICCMLVVYFIAGFVQWDLNASRWNSEVRMFVAFFGVMFSLIAVAINHDRVKVNKN